MKILITGAGGQLASEIEKILLDKKCSIGEIDEKFLNCNVICLDKSSLDISDLNQVDKKLKELMPDIIINCAAYTNVDGCESNKDLAFKVNSLGPRNIAMIAQNIGAKVVHISTDYVYSGEGDTPFCEYDMVNPISVYGRTKLLGDEYVKNFCDKYFIVRTSWVYGTKGKNFVYTIMNRAKELGKLKVVNDQFGSPTNCEDLAYHILKIMNTEEYGIYNCTGNGICTWYDFASKIIEFSNIKCDITPCKTGEFKTVAKRPAYSYLDNMMIRNTVGDEMRNWEEALREFISIVNK